MATNLGVELAPSGVYPPSYSSASSSFLSPAVRPPSHPHHTSSSSSSSSTPSSSTTPLSESESVSGSSSSLSSTQLSSLSPSPSASPPPTPHHVLLLLDIQLAMLEPAPVGVPASLQVKDKLAHILAYARAANPPPLIVHVRNNGDAGDADEPGSPGWELIFPTLPGELIIDKRKNNAFAGTKLGSLIPVDAEIVVAGFQTDYSIRATCSAALTRGNGVLLIRGAHATFDRIEVLHGGGITPAWRIEQEIEAELEEAGVYLLDMKDLPEVFMDR